MEMEGVHLFCTAMAFAKLLKHQPLVNAINAVGFECLLSVLVFGCLGEADSTRAVDGRPFLSEGKASIRVVLFCCNRKYVCMKKKMFLGALTSVYISGPLYLSFVVDPNKEF